VATKKKAAAKKRPAKRVAAKRPAKRTAKRAVKKTAKRAVKKSAKRSTKKVLKRSANTVDVSKLVIPPVPSRGSASTSSFSSTSAPKAAPAAAPKSPAKKNNSSGILFLVIAGIVLLAIFALSNTSSDDDAAPKPTPSESVTDEPSEEPTAEPSESASGSFTYEAPSKFVAINNASGGVTLRWVAPTASEGLIGYLVSISYNAVDFIEVATVPADQLNLDVAKVGDEGGTQFFIQSVYSDGTKADGAKFALKGKYE